MKYLLLGLLSMFLNLSSWAQPKPGDLFKEYSWTVPNPTKPGQEPYLRVCGDGFYEDQTRKGTSLFPDGYVQDGWFTLPENLDLSKAVRAEVLVEKMLCHDGSTGLSVKFNQGEFLKFPEAAGIPFPQSEYLHHIYTTVSVPLSTLKSGLNQNKFRFTLDKTQRWGMPQNMVYGMVLRIYYESNAQLTASLKGLSADVPLGENVDLSITASDKYKKVDFIGYYEGLNMEGDGIYTQWHYNYFKGQIASHLGSSVTGSYTWNTEWIPDQTEGIKLAAFVRFKNGYTYFTQPIENLKIKRSFKIELAKPYDIPRRWATREREFQTAFDLKGNPLKAEKFRVVATTWSPGYMNGVYLNNFLLMDREACKYCFHIIDKVIDHPEFLQNMNAIKTGFTPLYRGKMTHGTEIQYPGFMVLVKYKPD